MPPRSSLAAGERIELVIDKAVYRGLGLGRHQGQVVFVPRAFPGERLAVRITSLERGFARGRAEEVRLPAPERRPAPCPRAETCGGCAYQQLGYDAQLALKRDILAEALRRAGAPFEGEIPVRSSPETGWRLHATQHFAVRGQALHLGLHEEGTHRVVDLDECPQLSPAMNEAARGLKSALAAQPSRWPRLRDLHLAEGTESGLVATLAAEIPLAEAAALAGLRSAAPGLTGLGFEAREGRFSSFALLSGSPRLAHLILGQRYSSHALAFFQANRFLVEALVSTVVELTKDDGPVLDLYSGVGLFSLPLAARGQEVRGVEISSLAVEDAQENGRRLGLSSLRFERADVRQALAVWPPREGEQVILDPPRTGAGAGVVELVAARRPRAIVYVSCDPPTLGRDLAQLAALGYRADTVRAFDMFPDTFHLETVVRLRPDPPRL